MVTWLAVVVPVASLVAGSVLTMWGQGRTDRRALERQRVSEALVSERERQARLDTFAIKRFEFDRETLIELQQILLGSAPNSAGAREGARSRVGFGFDAATKSCAATGKSSNE